MSLASGGAEQLAPPAYRLYLQNGQQPDSATVLAAAVVVANNATRTAANAITLLRIILLLEKMGGASTMRITLRRSSCFKVKSKISLDLQVGLKVYIGRC